MPYDRKATHSMGIHQNTRTSSSDIHEIDEDTPNNRQLNRRPPSPYLRATNIQPKPQKSEAASIFKQHANTNAKKTLSR